MIITRRAASSNKREDANGVTHGATDSVESGGAVKDSNVYHLSSGKSVEKLRKETHNVINKQSLKSYLKTITIWGSLLCIGHQLGLNSCRQQSSELSDSIRGHAASIKEIYDARNCESYLAQIDKDGKRIDSVSLPIYTEEEWQQFRQLWVDQGGKNAEKYYKKSDKRRSKAPPDFVPPFKAGQTKDGKGRGVFATRDIKKGEMTYGGTKNYIFFTTGHDYRRFLDAFDDETACDLMKFTWPQEGIGPRGERLIWGPMDDNALQNHAGSDKANTGCPPHVYCGNFDEYALRDIKKGEELLCDYGEFFSLNFLEFKKWKWFGL